MVAGISDEVPSWRGISEFAPHDKVRLVFGGLYLLKDAVRWGFLTKSLYRAISSDSRLMWTGFLYDTSARGGAGVSFSQEN